MNEPVEHLGGLLGLLMRYPDLTAAIIGLFLSWCATQFVKKQIPASWSDDKYRHVVQITGFIFGWAFTAGAWALFDPTATHFEKFYYAAGMGFASPALYSLIVPYIGTKFPRIGKALSGRPSDDA